MDPFDQLMDPDDLVTAAEVARLLDLSGPRAVSVYRAKLPTFPSPRIEKGGCVLWDRRIIEAWGRTNPGRLRLSAYEVHLDRLEHNVEYRAGYDAAKAGHPTSICPHPRLPATDLLIDWYDGWRSGQF